MVWLNGLAIATRVGVAQRESWCASERGIWRSAEMKSWECVPQSDPARVHIGDSADYMLIVLFIMLRLE